MTSGLLDLARRLLHLWVRLRLFPDDPAALGIDPALPVCYVLRENWLSNRLVLREAVARAGKPALEYEGVYRGQRAADCAGGSGRLRAAKPCPRLPCLSRQFQSFTTKTSRMPRDATLFDKQRAHLAGERPASRHLSFLVQLCVLGDLAVRFSG